jgi:hypothetical protein
MPHKNMTNWFSFFLTLPTTAKWRFGFAFVLAYCPNTCNSLQFSFLFSFKQGLTHEEAARIIANSYADRSVPELKLLMSPSTFRPNANYQPEN